MGPYVLHQVVDKDTVFNILPDLLGAIKAYGGEPFLLMSGSHTVFSDAIEAFLGKQHVVYVDTTTGNGFSRLQFIWQAVKFLRANKGTVVTNLTGAISYGFDAALAGILTNSRVVVLASGNEIKTRQYAGRYIGMVGKLIWLIDAFREWFAFKIADTAIVRSLAEKKRVGKICGAEKIKICTRGVDLNRYYPHGEHSATMPLKVLFVGRNSPEKGADIFFEVARILAGDERFEFTVLGDFPIYSAGNLNVLGYVDPSQMPAAYRNHSVLLMTSRTEGFPNVMVQAMASGLIPAVPSHLLADYIEDGKNGLLISLDPAEISKKLVLLSDTPECVGRLKVEARSWVKVNFDSEKCKNHYAEVVLS